MEHKPGEISWGSEDDVDNQPWERNDLRRIVFGVNHFSEGGTTVRRGKVRRICARIVESHRFRFFCAMAILANAVLIGWLSDYQMKELGKPLPIWVLSTELGFSIVFALEVTLKIVGHGRDFFVAQDAWWNVFDVALVAHDMFEASHGKLGLSFLRVLRIFKMLRLMHLVRYLRRFRELRLITNALLGASSAFLWSSLLVVGITFLFGVILLQACHHFLTDKNTHPSRQEEELLRKYWGSILKSMLSLFVASTSGEDWNTLARPLLPIGWWAYAVFATYILFFLFVVTNVVTSLFIEATMQMAANDSTMGIQNELNKKDSHIERLSLLFKDLDANHDGVISYRDLVATINDPRMMAFTSSLGIDLCDVKSVFQLLSGNLRKPIDLETFVVGCIKLKGEAKAVDMHKMLNQQAEVILQLRRMCGELPTTSK